MDIGLFKKGLKRWSLWTLLALALMISISDGMPGHTFWPILRYPVGISLALAFLITLYHLAMFFVVRIEK
jgi:hypothetical protein